jgi:hemerythrin
MTLFVWQDIYSVGVDKIDAQHRNLFEIANRFHDACVAQAARSRLIQIFNELVTYTASHFADEENMLRAMNCPDYERHKENHTKLVGLVLNYKSQMERGEPEVETRAMEFIKTWLNGHILGMDRNYRPCVNNAAQTA